MELQTPGGILSRGPPPQSVLPSPSVISATAPQTAGRVNLVSFNQDHFRAVPPATLAVLAASSCALAPGATPDGNLRRWYAWKVRAHSKFSPPLSDGKWSWKLPPDSVTFPAVLPAALPGGDYEFTLWTPFPRATPYGVPSYQQLAVSADVKNGSAYVTSGYAQGTVSLPSVEIVGSNVRATSGGSAPAYTASFVAKAMSLCQGPPWTYRWQRNGRPLSLEGPGPHDLTFDPKGVRLPDGSYAPDMLTVFVTDGYRIQTAEISLPIQAPPKEAEISPRCAVATTPVPFTMPPGLSSLGQSGLATRQLCGSVRLVAEAENSEPIGIAFPDQPLTAVEWTDLKYAAPSTGNQWRPLPSASLSFSKTQLGGDTVTIAIGTNEVISLQATVTMKDSLGRTAVANAFLTNDFTPASQIADVLGRLWAVWRPGKPLTGSVALRPGGDTLETEVAILLAQARRVAAHEREPHANDRFAALHRSFNHLQRYGFARVARERGIAFSGVPAPKFTVRPARTLEDSARGRLSTHRSAERQQFELQLRQRALRSPAVQQPGVTVPIQQRQLQPQQLRPQ
jgi:hypothetical protein